MILKSHFPNGVIFLILFLIGGVIAFVFNLHEPYAFIFILFPILLSLFFAPIIDNQHRTYEVGDNFIMHGYFMGTTEIPYSEIAVFHVQKSFPLSVPDALLLYNNEDRIICELSCYITYDYDELLAFKKALKEKGVKDLGKLNLIGRARKDWCTFTNRIKSLLEYARW